MVSASDRLHTAKTSEKHTAKQNAFTKMQEQKLGVNQQTSKHFLDHEEASTFLISYKVLFIIQLF